MWQRDKDSLSLFGGLQSKIVWGCVRVYVGDDFILMVESQFEANELSQ